MPSKQLSEEALVVKWLSNVASQMPMEDLFKIHMPYKVIKFEYKFSIDIGSIQEFLDMEENNKSNF